MRKIALEEHFMTPGFEHYEKAIADSMAPGVFEDFSKRLAEFGKMRIEAMDQAGIDICVLSQTSPGLQIEQDPKLAVARARETNNFLAEEIAKHPQRYGGFAHLAMQDTEAAIAELDRCINDLGFKGAMINGHTNGIYLDEPVNFPFWQHVAKLDVPIYLHPANPFDSPHVYSGHPELTGPTWGWGAETGAHALRLIFSGLFDKLPTIKVILGHMGEMLPFMLWRFDSRAAITKQKTKLKKQPSDYIKENFVVTTSGVCANAPLLCSIEALGEDNVLFSVDYPYEYSNVAAEFIESAPVSEAVRAKICYQNAERILKL